jgi:hypothetical protein
MRRFWILIAITLLTATAGCDADYNRRLATATDNLKFVARINKNLTEAPTSPGFDQIPLFIRPPRPMALAQEFQLAAVNVPGQFDLAATFLDPQDNKLHVLARFKKARRTAKNAPPPQPRGPFKAEIMGILGGVYGITGGKFNPDKQSPNTFERMDIKLQNDRFAQVYLYTKGDLDVALIWDYPNSQKAALASKIVLCLKSFAVGPRAKSSFSGNLLQEEAAPGTGGAVSF